MKSTDLEDYDTLVTKKSLEHELRSLKSDLAIQRSERILRMQYVIMSLIAIISWIIVIVLTCAKFIHP
jgi:hypothetical protein